MGSWRLEPLYHRLSGLYGRTPLNLYQNMSSQGATRTSYTFNTQTRTIDPSVADRTRHVFAQCA